MNAEQAVRLVLERSFFGCQDSEQVFVFAAHHPHLRRRRRRRRRRLGLLPLGQVPPGRRTSCPQGCETCLREARETCLREARGERDPSSERENETE